MIILYLFHEFLLSILFEPMRPFLEFAELTAVLSCIGLQDPYIILK